jgi:hypothetical protein
MADKKTVAIFDPSGTVRLIPEDQAEAAIAAGGIRAVKMSDPQGKARWVREHDVDAARQSGGKLIEDGLSGAAERFFGKNPVGDTVRNMAEHAKNAVTGAYHQMTDAPKDTPERIAAASGPFSLGLHRIFAGPTLDAAREAWKQVRARNIGANKDPYDKDGNYQPTAVSSTMDAVPIVGPWARNVENEARTKGVVPALAGLATDFAVPEAAGKLRNVPGAAKGFAKRAAGAVKLDEPIPGDTVTPRQRWEAARKQGVNLDTAQATNAKVPAAVKKVTEHSLFGGSKFEENNGANVDALHSHAAQVLDDAHPKALSREEFGETAKQRLLDHQRMMNEEAGDLYRDLDKRVGGKKPDTQMIRDTARQIVKENAEYYDKHPDMLNGPEGRAWRIVRNLAETGEVPAATSKTSPIVDASGRPITTEVQKPAVEDTWSDLHKLRSDLLDMTRGPELVGERPTGWIKMLTGAVDDVMTDPAGMNRVDSQKFRDANDLYQRMKSTYDNPQSKLYHIVRAPDGLTAANGLANITPKVARLFGEAAPELVPQLQRQTMERMFNPAGNDVFDLKNLPTRFNRTMKENLSGVLSPEQIQKIEDLARTSKLVNFDSNTSGTAKIMQPVSEGAGIASGVTTALATGHPAAAVAPIVYPVASRIAAKAMVSPEFNEHIMDNSPAPPPKPSEPMMRVLPAAAAETQPKQEEEKTEDPEGEPQASLYHPDTHIFSRQRFRDALPEGDHDQAARDAEEAGYEVVA